MRWRAYFSATFVILAGAVISGCAQKEALASTPIDKAAPVVVELYTSEGCSSCPPADRVLADLEAKYPQGVIPLAFHVDYWDGIGWKDPFSSPLWTDRQQSYSRAQGRGNLYTPQMIVDGREEFVGSDASHADSAIATAAKHAKAAVTLSIEQGTITRSLSVKIDALPAQTAPSEAILALIDARATVDVKSGENSGRRLDHTAIVRTLRSLGPVQASGGHFTVALDPSWASKRAVVLIEEQGSRAITGAATLQL